MTVKGLLEDLEEEMPETPAEQVAEAAAAEETPAETPTPEETPPAAEATPPTDAPAVETPAVEAAVETPPVTTPEVKYEPKPGDWRLLREEKRERERLAAENQQLKEQLAQQKQPAVAPAVAKPAEPAVVEDPEPVAEDDPIGHADWAAREALRMARQTNETVEGLRRQSEQSRQRSDFERVIVQQETVFRGEHPDYDAAVEFLAAREGKRWERLGVPKEQVAQRIYNRAAEVMREAAQNGIPLPHAFYELALEEGWTGPKPAAETPVVAAPAAPAAKTPQQKLAESKARSEASATSLSSIPARGAGVVPKSARDLNDLTEAEMDVLTKQNPNWLNELTD